MTADPNQETTWPTEAERAVLAQHCWCEANATDCGECDGERAEILDALAPHVARREREAAAEALEQAAACSYWKYTPSAASWLQGRAAHIRGES